MKKPIYTTQNASVNKKAFTLMEMLLVVVIISMTYAIFAMNFSKIHKNEKADILKINSYLRKHFGKGFLKIVCPKFEKSCYVLNDKHDKLAELKLFEDNQYTVYKKINDQVIEAFFPSYIAKNGDIKDVWFSYTLYPNDSNSNLILDMGDKGSILFYSYLNKPEIFSDLEKAQEKMLQAYNSIKE